MKNKRKPVVWYRRCLCTVMASILTFTLVACRREEGEPLKVTENTTEKVIDIQTKYGTLEFPEDLFANLRHVEVVEGKIAMEVFYMA